MKARLTQSTYERIQELSALRLSDEQMYDAVHRPRIKLRASGPLLPDVTFWLWWAFHKTTFQS